MRSATRVEIEEEGAGSLADYARISVAFEVRVVMDARASATSQTKFILVERQCSTPFVKDYDAIPNNAPLDWPRRFDITRWGFLVARVDGARVGGAAIALRASASDTAGDDVAVLWDIRVAPDARGKGVGSALLAAAERWAAGRGARRFEAETQNINVPACRFYEARGFALEAIDPLAYPELPKEIQFLWYKDVGG